VVGVNDRLLEAGYKVSLANLSIEGVVVKQLIGEKSALSISVKISLMPAARFSPAVKR
jgi:hypothetical protein